MSITLLEAVEAPSERSALNGVLSQVRQAEIDISLARGAIEATIDFVKTSAGPGLDRASDDIFTITAIGDLEIRLHAAEETLRKAALVIDRIPAEPSADDVARASVAVATARILSTEIAVLAANKLFELGGTRSTLPEQALDRHWRDARAHTLQDPVRWKFFHIGNFVLNGAKPPQNA